MMTFYMTPGSCSTGIHILLEELELVFSAHVLNLPAGDTQTPEFLAINPKGTIPVLAVEPGKCFTEFQSIAWWLAQTYPKAQLLPDDLEQQARVIDLMSYIVGTIHLQGFTRLFTTERYLQRETDRPAVETQGRTLVLKGFNIIAKQYGHTNGYLFERFSIADAALFYVTFWAERIGLPLPDYCQKHLSLMKSRPVVKRVLAEEGYRIA